MITRILILCVLMPLLAACTLNRYVLDPYEKLALVADRGVNPGPSGAPAPITVKVYELSARQTFDNLDFDAAFGNAQVLLSDELLSSGEYILLPGQSVRHRIALRPNAAYVAVVAAYRDIDRARWKLVYEVDGNWYQGRTVTLAPAAVVLGEPNAKEAKADDAIH